MMSKLFHSYSDGQNTKFMCDWRYMSIWFQWKNLFQQQPLKKFNQLWKVVPSEHLCIAAVTRTCTCHISLTDVHTVIHSAYWQPISNIFIYNALKKSAHPGIIKNYFVSCWKMTMTSFSYLSVTSGTGKRKLVSHSQGSRNWWLLSSRP